MPQATSNQSPVFPPVTSLAVHRQTDEDYLSKLSAGFSSIQSWSQYAKVGQLIATISNVGGQPTRAYSVVWTIQGADGTLHSMHANSITRHYMLLGKLETVQPNEIRLISPFFNLSASQYGDNPEKLTGKLPSNIPWLDGTVTGVQVSAVIHEDNSTAGDDLFKLREYYVAVRHAEHDAGVAMSMYLKNNPSITPQQLDIELSARAGRDIGVSGKDAKVRYMHARAQEAQNLRNILHWTGLPGFQAELVRRIGYKRDVLHLES